ncbi:MAG: cation:proton antiporter [Kiritimatiellae bacterium]|nr:cation:proton antiporter [Kiritimatiellia bacterium]
MIAEHHIGTFLLEFFLLLLLARGAGELFKRWKLPAVTAELLVGILLGPTVLGRFCPAFHVWLFPQDETLQIMLGTASWLGVFLLMLDTGLEIDFSLAWRHRTPALAIALCGLVLPLAVAYPLFRLLLPRIMPPGLPSLTLLAFFLATAAAISAMPVAARALRDLGLLKTDAGLLTLSALAVKDILCWVLFAVLLALATNPGASPLPRAAAIFAATLGFTALVLVLGRPLSNRLFTFLRDHHCPEPSTSLTLILLLGLLFGTLTARLGVHALFGFFLAGVLMGESPALAEGTRTTITQMVHAIFVPLFFVSIGLRTDLAADFSLPLVLLLTLLEMALRYLGTDLGARLAHVARPNRALVAIAHTPGGMMEIVLALLAYDAGLLPASLYVAILASAMLTSLLMGPWLSLFLTLRTRAHDAVLAARAARVAARAAAAAAAAPAPVFLSRVAEALLPPAHVLLDLPAADRPEALRLLAAAAADRLAAPELAQKILDAALARERAMGTGLGDGIAIPHVRLPEIPTPVLLLARPRYPIDWDAPDSRPADLLFFLVDPVGDSDNHVAILSRIARAMSRPAARDALRSAASPDDAATRFAVL